MSAMHAEARRVTELATRPGVPAHLAATLTRHAAHNARVGDSLALAGNYWVTGDMTRAGLDASQDCPGMDMVDLIEANGLLCLSEPLPPYTVPGGLALRDGDRTDVPHDDPVPVDALAWLQIPGGGITLLLCCRPERLPLPLFVSEPPLVPFASITTPPLPITFTDLDLRTVDKHGATVTTVEGEQVGPLALIATMWVLMVTPTVSEVRTVEVGKGKGRRGDRVVGPVQVVDLRPLRHARTDEDPGDGGRRLTTRHVVRGHWTRQPYGPARSLRKKIWVPSYIRGPEGTPLVVREQVLTWRR